MKLIYYDKTGFYAKRTKIPAFSEDESLFVDFLPAKDQPGVHVRRINRQEEVDDDKLLAHWEKIIAEIPKEKRTGRWHIAYCLSKPNGTTQIVTRDYPIMFFSPSSKVRIPGWPMSSLQGSIKLGKPHSETSPEEHKIINQETDKIIRASLEKLTIG
ncbi:hypothetical protein HY085_01775 [Candidatus Gottesmanbacteria bacterium]|nr:hypothetical protein [Candidatus Gottesmanbacteria bacterium]